MKEIQLPKAIAVRYYFDGESPKTIASGGDFSTEMAVIERNGSEIISGAVLLEERMIEAVCKLLFGKNSTENWQSQFFVDEVIGTSDFQFSFKRRVFTRILEQRNILAKEEIDRLKAGLNKVMEWRNAFAHGSVLHENGAGFVLQYYSGGHKESVLDDAFFEKVEETIRSCLYQCNGIIQSE